MSLRKGTTVVWGALLALILGTTTTFAHIRIFPGVPPLVHFTGVLSPRTDHQEGRNTLTFSVRGQEWRFQVTDVMTFGGTNRRDEFILRDIFPGSLRVSGPSTVLDALQNADGQTITLQGRLYVSDRRFLITTVEATSDDAAEQSLP